MEMKTHRTADNLQKVAEGLTSIAEFQAVGGTGFYNPARNPKHP
jgi:hypothetical protein